MDLLHAHEVLNLRLIDLRFGDADRNVLRDADKGKEFAENAAKQGLLEIILRSSLASRALAIPAT
jgi:hypothetical protein